MTEIAEIGTVALDGFEVWDRSTEAPAGEGVKRAFVSISPAGTIAPNVYAQDMLETEAVMLLYDKDRRRLGFVPTDLEAENRYLWPNRYGSGQIPARKFCEHYDIHLAKTTRYYSLELIDGVLIANLGDPATSGPERMGS